MRAAFETLAGIVVLAAAVWAISHIVEMKHAQERAAGVARK